jgi:hypothetical protein
MRPSAFCHDARERYDYVLVDCPPQVGLLTFNALFACAEAIVPVDPSFFSLHGIAKLLETFDVVARKTGHQIAVRALLTLYTGRAQFVLEVADEIRKYLAGRHFDTVIRHSIKLAEAASHGLPVAGYCTRCAGFEDYEALAEEVLGMETTWERKPSAPQVTPEGVLFSLEARNASRVQLVGDFNDWKLDETEMKPEGAIWTSTVKLEPGRYQYRYVIDGQWASDPMNPEAEPSPYGGHNSVLVLGQ